MAFTKTQQWVTPVVGMSWKNFHDMVSIKLKYQEALAVGRPQLGACGSRTLYCLWCLTSKCSDGRCPCKHRCYGVENLYGLLTFPFGTGAHCCWQQCKLRVEVQAGPGAEWFLSLMDPIIKSSLESGFLTGLFEQPLRSLHSSVVHFSIWGDGPAIENAMFSLAFWGRITFASIIWFSDEWIYR